MKNAIVNLNGNSANSLKAELLEAYNATASAREALSKLTIHGRNYQVCKDPNTAFETDREEWLEVKRKLESVSKYLIDCEAAIRKQL